MLELYIKLDNSVKVSLFIFKLNYTVQCILWKFNYIRTIGFGASVYFPEFG